MDVKTILITGGSRGLGRAMAVALADLGHRVAVTGRDNDKLREVVELLPGGLGLDADVTDTIHTRTVVDEVTADLGPIDVLINNAGVGGGKEGPAPLSQMDPEDWWSVQETNVKGPMLYSHAVLPGMIERGHGIIINTGSYVSIRPAPFASAYAASKAALARFTDSLAPEVAEAGVQVFCVSPGLVLTDMTKDIDLFKDVPAENWNQPEDIARLACELVTGNYGALSGRFIHVNDNLQELLEQAERIGAEHLFQLRMLNLEGLIE